MKEGYDGFPPAVLVVNAPVTYGRLVCINL